MEINAPETALFVLERLEHAGHRAYLVGGCVRDSALGLTPSDWDIAASARPEQVVACFDGYPVLETGIRHGTVTVLVDGSPIEVTTFREDGEYSDGRRPDQVHFVDDLRADLARRDFTVNAMAYHPREGIVDYFGGIAHIRERLIACVGDPEERLAEDALRILRAVRFSATLGFWVEERTAAAALDMAPTLARVAPERIRAELDKALVGVAAADALRRFAPVVAWIIPEMAAVVGPEGGAAAWERVLGALTASPPHKAVRLALLLGECGGWETAGAILRRLRYDNDTRRRVEDLLRHRDARIEATLPDVRRWLNRLGEGDFRLLLAVRRAVGELDAPETLDTLEALVDEIVGRGLCCRLGDLAVDGDALMALGIPRGRGVGALLRRLLELVMDGALPNEREALLAHAGQLLEEMEKAPLGADEKGLLG